MFALLPCLLGERSRVPFWEYAVCYAMHNLSLIFCRRPISSMSCGVAILTLRSILHHLHPINRCTIPIHIRHSQLEFIPIRQHSSLPIINSSAIRGWSPKKSCKAGNNKMKPHFGGNLMNYWPLTKSTTVIHLGSQCDNAMRRI